MTEPQFSDAHSGLRCLLEAPIPVYCSASVTDVAVRQAVRFAHAYAVLGTLLRTFPDLQLLVLAEADWSSHAVLPEFGLTHYDLRRQLVVAPGEAAGVLDSALELLATAAPEQFDALRAQYTRSDGILDLMPHIDTWIVHDLAHAAHLQRDCWFPRRWLMELFADLFSLLAIQRAEPQAVATLLGLPRALAAIPAAAVRFASLAEFEEHSLGGELAPANYFWYHGRLFLLAETLFQADGAVPLLRLWQQFVLSNPGTLSDAALLARLEHVHPLLARAARDWPELTSA